MPIDQPPDYSKMFSPSQFVELAQPVKHTLSIWGPDRTVWIDIDLDASPPKVNLHGHDPDAAGKLFWNAVSAVVNRPPLFPTP